MDFQYPTSECFPNPRPAIFRTIEATSSCRLRSSWPGQRNVNFLGTPSRIRQRCGNILGLKIGIVGKDFLCGCPNGNQADNGSRRNAHSPNARLSAHHIGIECNSAKIRHFGCSVVVLESPPIIAKRIGLVQVPRCCNRPAAKGLAVLIECLRDTSFQIPPAIAAEPLMPMNSNLSPEQRPAVRWWRRKPSRGEVIATCVLFVIVIAVALLFLGITQTMGDRNIKSLQSSQPPASTAPPPREPSW